MKVPNYVFVSLKFSVLVWLEPSIDIVNSNTSSAGVDLAFIMIYNYNKFELMSR